MAVIPWNDIIVQWGAYLVVGLGVVGIIARFQGGFFGAWLKVRLSMEKLVLVKVKGELRDYFKPGTIESGFLVFRDIRKDTRRLAIKKNTPCFYRAAGVNTVDVSDQLNAVLTVNLEGVTGFDAVMFEDLYVRAWNKPQIIDDKTKLIIAALVIMLLILGFMAFFMYNLGLKIDGLSVASSVGSTLAASGGV